MTRSKHPEEGAAKSSPRNTQRRKAMKVVTAAGASLAVSQWSKPVVLSIALPAHAAASPYRYQQLSGNEFNVKLRDDTTG